MEMSLVGFKDFMLWDGVAFLVFAGIVLLGFRFEHPFLGALLAGSIPVANIVLWVNHLVVGPESLWISPFLSIGVSIVMLFALALPYCRVFLQLE